MKTSRAAWALVAVLWVVAALNYLDRQVIFSVFPPLRQDLHLSSLQLGLLGTAFLWVYAVLSPVCGYLADRFGRTRAITASLLVWSAVTWATAHVHSFGQLAGTRALMGISEAFYLPAALALISDHHGERTRSLATGIHTSGIYVGMIAGGAGGGWLAQRYGWRAPFQLLGIVGLAYLAVLAPVMRRARVESSAAPPRFLGSVRELMRLPGYGWMAAVFVGTSLANWMFYTWLPLYLYEHFHMSLAGAGAYTTFTYVASVVGIVSGGWLADRWGTAAVRGRLLTQAVGVCAGAPALFALGTTASHHVLAAGLVVFGVGKGLYDANIMPVLAQVARPELRSTGYGVFNFLGCLAGGISAPLAGWMKSGIGLEGALMLAGAVLLLSSVLLLRIRIPEGKGLPSYEPISHRA